jgi:transposase
MVARRFTDEQEQIICNRYIEGESAKQLAKAYTVTNVTIARILKRNGVKARSISEAMGGLAAKQQAEACRRYIAGESTVQLAKSFGISSATVGRLLKCHSIAMRSTGEAQSILTEAQQAEACRRYIAGESTNLLAKMYGVSGSVVGRLLRRNGIELRSQTGFDDSVQHAIDCTGRHSHARDCNFYIFDLVNHPGYSKPGIAFDVEIRVAAARGEYGEEHLRVTFATRQEAFFLEQALLDATRGSAACPDELQGWIGASEVRAMPAADLVAIAVRLIDELEELGVWEFASRLVPMTAAQRAICQQRAMKGAPAVAPAGEVG